MNTILVGLGGLAGSIARFGVGIAAKRIADLASFPLGTVLVNLVGCLAVGFIMRWGEAQGGLSEAARSLIVVGFLGGFTTFSAFGHETVALIQGGQSVLALMNATIQVVGGLGCVLIGRLSASALLRSF